MSITTNYNFTNTMNNTSQDLGLYLQQNSNVTFNPANDAYTNTTKTIENTSACVISQNNISVNTEGASNTGEIYTFGKSIAPMWVAGGVGGNTLAYSTDGFNFIGLGSSIFTAGCYSISWNGYRWVAVGSGGNSLAYSNDGINWAGLGTTIFTTNGFGLTWSPLKNIWVAGGNSGNSLAYSYDGINWTGVSGSVTNMGTGRCVFWNGTRFITAGETTNTFAMSFDGINWTYSSISTATKLYTITYNGSLWVCGGENSSTTAGLFYAKESSLGNTAATCVTQFVNITTPKVFGSNTNYVASLCWNGKLFIGLGGTSSGNTIGYSYDGINWVGLGTTVINTTGTTGILWDGTKFFGTGTSSSSSSSNTLTYSYDGLNWTGMGNTIFSAACNSITYNGARPHKLLVSPNRMVAGMSVSPFASYSNNNGLTWYPIQTNLNITQFTPLGIAYNGKIWLLGGYSVNTIFYSYDGINWTGLGNKMFSTSSWNFSWSNYLQRWVAISAASNTNNTLAYSNDGINWVGLGSSILGNGISYNEKLKIWCLIGGTNKVSYSYDGINWNNITYNSNITSMSLGTISNNGNMFIATGDSTYNFIYSYDGINWNTQNTTTISGGLVQGISWSNSLQRWVAGGFNGTNNKLVYSNDGINWIGLGPTIFTSFVYNVTWNKTYFVANGSGGNSIAYSKDGITWVGLGNPLTSTQTHNIFQSNQQNSVIIQHPTIAVGRSTAGTYNTIAYSPDGIIWYGLGNIIFSTAGYAVAWNGTMWIAVGQGTGNTFAYSIDGVSWTGLGTTIFATAGWCVAWNGTLWVAGGEGTGNTIAYSSNGLSWTGAGSSVFTTRCRGVAYYQGTPTTNKWMAVGVGGNTIASSTNGTTWTGAGTATFSVGGYGITCNPYNWFAVGEGTGNTIAYSTDNGVTWTGNGKTVFTTAGYGVAWNGPLQACVAVGAGGNTIAYSSDFGVTWTGKGATVFTSAGYGVAYNGLYFVASGAGGNTVAWSYDGNNNWTGARGTTLFDMSGCGIASNYVGTNTFQAQLSMNSNVSYLGSIDKQILDVVSPQYYGMGYSNMTASFQMTNLY